MVELYEHQKTALDLLRLNDGFALFLEQGLGKTYPVLFRLAELAATNRIDSALVCCPKAVVASWEDKISQLDEKQRAALASIDFEITTYELIWRRERTRNGSFDALVLDESHYIKNPKAKRTKQCLKLALKARYRYLLTGTPMSNGHLCDFWSQMAAVDPVRTGTSNYPAYPACFGGISYYKWLDNVAYLNKWHQPYRYIDPNAIQQTVWEHSYRLTKDEYLNLPDKMPDEILRVKLSKDAQRDYKSMAKNSAIVALDVLAPNSLARSVRLRQICSGYLTTDYGELHEYECSKQQALSDFLSSTEEKAVVFCQFTRSIDNVCETLDALKIQHVVLDGRQNDKGIWHKFQEDDETRVLVAQYQTASAGVDLFAARLMLFYEPCLSSTVHQQARDRIHRIGQTLPVCYFYLLTDGTIEFAIYKALSQYADFDAAFFEDYLEEVRAHD